MAEQTRVTLKTYFETGDTPTQAQFVDLLDSTALRDDSIRGVVTVTGNYTLALADVMKLIRVNSATPVNITIPTNAAVPIDVCRQYWIRQVGVGSVTIVPSTGVTVNSGTVTVGGQNKEIVLTKILANEWDYSPGTAGVTGGGADVTAPTLVTATIEDAAPNQIVLTFSETLDGGSVPATGDFVISPTRTISSVGIAGAVVTLTLTTSYGAGQLANVSYTPGTNPIQDPSGNDAAAIVSQPVTNNVVAADTTPPTVVSATATNATNIRIVFSEPMGAVTTAGWTFNNPGAITPSAVALVSGNTYDFTVSGLTSGDTITRTYNSGTGATTDVAANELVSFTTQPVTNSIVGYDSDALAHFNEEETASSSTIPTFLKDAANQVYVDLKANSLYSKVAIMRFGFGTGTRNGVNPGNANTDFRATFTGSPTISNAGITYASGQWADLHYVHSTDGGPDATHEAAHAVIVNGTSGTPFGATDGTGTNYTYFFAEASSTNGSQAINGGGSNPTTDTRTGIFIFGIHDNSGTYQRRMMKNGVMVMSQDQTTGFTGGAPAVNLYEGSNNNNGSPNGQYIGTIGIHIVFKTGLTIAQYTTLHNILSTFKTASGR